MLHASPIFLLLCACVPFYAQVIDLGKHSFGIGGSTYTAEYMLNFTVARFGIGCSGDYVPAVIPSNIGQLKFFAPVPKEMSKVGCFTAGERKTPHNQKDTQLAEGERDTERTQFVRKFRGRSEPIPAALWFPKEPNNAGGQGENYVWLFPNGMINDMYDAHLPHCCMKVLDECDPPCVHGKCTGGNVCMCDQGFEGRDCASAICKSGTDGVDCKKKCACGLHGYCAQTFNFDTKNFECTCHPGFTGANCEEECPSGTWGGACSGVCPSCENGGKCDSVRGGCVCAESFVGPTCGKGTRDVHQDMCNEFSREFVVLPIFILVVIVLVAALFFEKKRSFKQGSCTPGNLEGMRLRYNSLYRFTGSDGYEIPDFYLKSNRVSGAPTVILPIKQ